VRNELQALHLLVPLLAEEQDWIERGLALPPDLSQPLGTGTSGAPHHSGS
jgi:hypothetical protein